MTPILRRHCQSLLLTLLLSASMAGHSETTTVRAGFSGNWIINEKMSDDTDRRVEESIRAAGGRPDSGGKRGKGRYRGGPAEHALYDHISYDEVLQFTHADPEFRLIYQQGFERVFYSDNRKRVVSASGMNSADKQDFSFASWDGDKLLVESRPRDGGWINETFEIIPASGQLRLTLRLKPSSFGVPINIVRIYDRLATTDPRLELSSPNR